MIFDPATTMLRSEDAAAILGVSPATVRGAISRGELAGERDSNGRWRVRLEAVLADPRAHPEVVELFTGERVLEEELAPAPRVERVRRDLFVRLDQGAELELLERAKDQHGSYRAAVVAGLARLAEDGMDDVEAAELLVERDIYRGRAEQAEARARDLGELVQTQLVEELYCPHCERLVSIEECEYELAGADVVELYHRPHGYRRQGGMLRGSTVIARRRVRAY